MEQPELSDYEKVRLANIAANNERLSTLGLLLQPPRTSTGATPKREKKKKKGEEDAKNKERMSLRQALALSKREHEHQLAGAAGAEAEAAAAAGAALLSTDEEEEEEDTKTPYVATDSECSADEQDTPALCSTPARTRTAGRGTSNVSPLRRKRTRRAAAPPPSPDDK